MAINSNTPRLEFVASAGQTEFDFNFKIFADSDMKVYQTLSGNEADETADLLLETAYSVSIDGDNGGTVTLNTGAAVGDKITLIRDLPYTRDYDYQTSGDLLAEDLDGDQEYQTYLTQQLEGSKTQFFRMPINQQGVSAVLPSVAANAYLRWNATGDALENDTTIPQAVIDTAANAVAAAASEANAAISETNAGNSATAAQLSDWEAEAERLTADSYATEAEDVPVNIVTSNGDGTFTYTPTSPAEYSALHWAAKSEDFASGAASNISVDTTNLNKNLSSADDDVQKALETLDDMDLGYVDVAKTIMSQGTAVVATGTLTITDGVFNYVDGLNDNGYNRTVDTYSGTPSFTGVSDGTKWIAKDELDTFTFYDEKPSLTPNGTNVWFNTEDGKQYQSSFIADGSTNTSTTDAVPTMTSNTAPSGVSSASSFAVGYEAYKAFDDITSTSSNYWSTSAGNNTGWLQYLFASPKAINKYTLRASNVVARTPKDWTIKASNTGVFGGEEVTLDTVTDETGWASDEVRTFTFSNATQYSYYRLDVSANNGDASYVALYEMELIEAEVQNGTPLTNPISFLKNPVVVSSEVPQSIDTTQSLFENVMSDLKVVGDIKTNGEFIGKNACTAWVNFDGSTIPPTINDSYNVSDVIRTSAGVYSVIFKEEMDNANYAFTGNSKDASYRSIVSGSDTLTNTTTTMHLINVYDAVAYDGIITVTVFGGKE